MNKELQIGEVGIIDGIKVECCPTLVCDTRKSICEQCAFHDASIKCIHRCTGFQRADGKEVYFKKIEE